MELLLKLGGIAGMAFVVGLSGAMMPGPLLAVTIRESTRRGAWAGPLLIVGHAILEAVLVAALVFGLAGVFKHPLVIILISFAGGAMMCRMGWDMIRSAKTLTLALETGRDGGMHPVLAGIAVSLANPYWTIWWATIGLGYLVMGLKFGWPGILAFFSGHIAADFAWYTLVGVGVAQGRQFLSDVSYRRLIMLCGAVLLLFGAWFFWTGAAACLAPPAAPVGK